MSEQYVYVLACIYSVSHSSQLLKVLLMSLLNLFAFILSNRKQFVFVGSFALKWKPTRIQLCNQVGKKSKKTTTVEEEKTQTPEWCTGEKVQIHAVNVQSQ